MRLFKDPHSKALEPNCLSPSACDYNTVSQGERSVRLAIEVRVGVDMLNSPTLVLPHKGGGDFYGNFLNNQKELHDDRP